MQQVVAVSVPRLARERGYFKVQKLGASQGLSPALEEPQLGWEQLEPGLREVRLPRVLLIKQSLHGRVLSPKGMGHSRPGPKGRKRRAWRSFDAHILNPS